MFRSLGVTRLSGLIAIRFRPVFLMTPLLMIGAPSPADEETSLTPGVLLAPVEVQADHDELDTTAPFDGYHAARAGSATKTATPLLQTSQSITVVGSEQIRDQDARTLAESLRSVAGVEAGQRGRRGLDDFTVRGFVQSAYLFRDGMRMDNDMWIQNDPFAFERIEVLKGPASILYGQIAPGGLVNLVTKRPTDDPMAELGVSVGNYQQRQYTADVSNALNEEGSVRYRMVGLYSSSDDEVDFVDRDRVYFAPSLTWDLSDDTRLTLLASYQKSHFVPVRGLPARGTVLPNPNGKIEFGRFVGVPGEDTYTTRQSLLGYLFEHQFSDTLSFRQNLRYNRYFLDGAFSGPTSLDSNGRDYNRRLNYRDVDGRMLTMDNQFQLSLSTGLAYHDLLLGVDYLDFTNHRIDHRLTVPALDLYDPDYSYVPGAATRNDANSGKDELTQMGVYIQDQIKFGDGWNLSLGLRRDRSDLLETRLNGDRTRTDPEATTGRAGLLYLFANGLAPYISYSESFVPVTGDAADGSAFEPETGEQQELGIKYESADQRLGATLAIYDLQRRNVTTPDPNDSAYSIQVGEQRHRGAELEVSGQVTQKLKLIATYTYMDVEVTRSNSGTEGKRPVLAPEQMANLWAKYDIGNWVPGMSVAVGVRYVGEQAGDQMNTFDVPDFTLFDSAVYYDTDHWRFALNGKNLSNKEYIVGCASETQCFQGDPRLINLSANYRF